MERKATEDQAKRVEQLASLLSENAMLNLYSRARNLLQNRGVDLNFIRGVLKGTIFKELAFEEFSVFVEGTLVSPSRTLDVITKELPVNEHSRRESRRPFLIDGLVLTKRRNIKEFLAYVNRPDDIAKLERTYDEYIVARKTLSNVIQGSTLKLVVPRGTVKTVEFFRRYISPEDQELVKIDESVWGPDDLWSFANAFVEGYSAKNGLTLRSIDSQLRTHV